MSSIEKNDKDSHEFEGKCVVVDQYDQTYLCKMYEST
jgi:hypothetical protein